MDPLDRTAIDGTAAMTEKFSRVDRNGTWRAPHIDGVEFRPTRPVPHEDGFVTEVARRDWPAIDADITQVHVSSTLPGRVRAWGLHLASTDRLFVVSGLVSIVVHDRRNGSATFGTTAEYRVSERNPGIVIIPPGVHHGWKNIGTEEAFVLNLPSVPYDHEGPDALDLPYDDPRASELVPWRWE